MTSYWLLCTTFMVYDDEGYVLQTLRDFSASGRLYDQVYTQYGPFFYLLYDFLHRIGGLEFTSMAGREIALFNWLAASLACAGITRRLTHSWAATLAALGVTYYHLWSMISEPGHPGSLLVVLIALTAWAGLELILRGKLDLFAVLTGVGGAALVLIKINVGVFFIAATGAWMLINQANEKVARTNVLVCGAALVLLPVALMKHFLPLEWAQIFATLAVVTAGTMVFSAAQSRTLVVRSRHLYLFVGAGLGAGLGAVVLVLFRGTTVSGLLEGVLLGPLRHPGVYHFAPQWRDGTLPVAAASALLAILCGRGRHRAWVPTVVSIGRLVLGGVILASYAEVIALNTLALSIGFALPLAWLFVFPLGEKKTHGAQAALAWIGLLLAEQYLHAYPIAGSQISWGTFLLLPLAAIGCHEAVIFLTANKISWARPLRLTIGAVVCATIIFMSGTLARLGWSRYTASEPLGLPGAENLRLLENHALSLRTISVNASAHGDMLFSLPGLYSFNQWTGLPTPTLANATHWFSLLSAAEQAGIIAALDGAKRPVIVVQRGVLDFLEDGKFPLNGRLFDHLAQQFTRVFASEGYEFWARKGRVIVPLNRAELLQPREPAAGLAARRINAVVVTERPVVAAEIMLLNTPLTSRARLSAVNARLSATPLRLDGSDAAPAIVQAWGQPLPPVARLVFDIPGELPNFNPRFAVLVLLDAQGRRVGEAGFDN
jgi:hypothetical protein